MKLALYETAPGEIYGRKYGVTSIGKPSTRVTLYPMSMKGLQDAISSATKSDAQVVKVERDYAKAEYLLREVRRLIKQGKGKKLFMPAIGIEQVVENV